MKPSLLAHAHLSVASPPSPRSTSHLRLSGGRSSASSPSSSRQSSPSSWSRVHGCQSRPLKQVRPGSSEAPHRRGSNYTRRNHLRVPSGGFVFSDEEVQEVFLELSSGTDFSWVLPIGGVRKVSYRPPGTEQNLLNQTSLFLREKSFGLIFGRSGSGKTTLLQLLAGLSEPTSGSICIQKYYDSGNPKGLSEVLTSQRIGIVFQFPERYFLAHTILEEVTFGWPRQKADFLLREQLTLKLQNAINSVGLNTISLDEDPQSLSGGFKRRLALAIQLVQTPDLLLLDEPLAGLDWKARADVVNLLKDLKNDHTILVASHDLRELYPLVDRSWRMEMGGIFKEEALPV